ncbi:MAG: RdgB/HAM1 family non-canonical purine NTP pyrophosphatase [Candidatus Cloacimonadota bacterium]|nr:RdgB/HAM1 family non-canonical purine NTP pyrophosphatase [Candidatus Cloacimonadota bacterium]
MKLVLATKNKDKIQEIKSLLQDLNIDILTFKDFDSFPDTIEDKLTLEGNAGKKAQAIWQNFKLPVLADDTGLFVDALNGKPGVYSSRFAGENATYEQNREKLLYMLKDIPKEKRTATFKTVIVFVDKKGSKFVVNGECKGYIGFEERGKNGFGYDSIFYYDNVNKSFAELSSEEKNKVSHRGIALRKIRSIIEENIKNI